LGGKGDGAEKLEGISILEEGFGVGPERREDVQNGLRSRSQLFGFHQRMIFRRGVSGNPSPARR
jgi:hypothetical protein